MGTKKWAEIKKLSKATPADRVEARRELADELRSHSLNEPRSVADRCLQEFVATGPVEPKGERSQGNSGVGGK